MNQREKLLAGGVLVAVVLWGANWGFGKYRAAVEQADNRLNNARQALADTEFEDQRGQRAVKQLLAWRTKSLPRVAGVAQSQYRTWLVDRLSEANLKVSDITPSRGRASTANFETLSYVVDGEGDLASLVKFLAAFYTSDQLHKINQLVINPTGKGNTLRVNLTVEAMMLRDADRDSGLNEAKSDRLVLESVDDYIDSIVARNIFAQYVPPPPPRPPRQPVVRRDPPPPPPPRPKFDDSKHAFVTAIVQSGDVLQAWVNVRTTGEVLRLKPGDTFEVGLLSGTVLDVRARQLVLELADQDVVEIELGDSLHDTRQALPSGGI